ncbi:MAG: diguanylate cyclase [Dehalococcoidales bacterium]|nr:diguanylate cyclase [Dehalococcoidales bacterium]
MNIYALFPLIAIVTYIPLLIGTVSSRPWQKRQGLFILFLISAISWSLVSFLLRGNILPQYDDILLQIILISYTWMAVQFYCFASSFFNPGQGRWLPFAYFSLAAIIIMVLTGRMSESLTISESKLYLDYGRGGIIIAIPLLVLATRMTYVFGRRLRILENPVLRNQLNSLMLSLFVLIISTIATFLPFGREFPLTHAGGIIIAFILSYATVRHQLVDIKVVLRQGLVWGSLIIIGSIIYAILFIVLHALFKSEDSLTTTFLAVSMAIMVTLLINKLHGYFDTTMGKAFQGQSYDYRQQLSDFANNIHNIFSLEEQGGELLIRISKALGCKRAYLLFLDAGSEDFTAKLVEPNEESNRLSGLRLAGQNPIIEYLRRERQLLTEETIAILPEFRGLWEQEKQEIKSKEIEVFAPLISRDRLIGILVLGRKKSGRYSLEDYKLVEDVVKQVAVSMEKEYLSERLREREEELSVINRCSAVITSSLDIQEIYDNFIEELKKIVDVNWAAIALIEENDLYFLALSSDIIGSAWKAGERIPIKGTATEWIAAHRKTVLEPDLSNESKFDLGEYYRKQGIRSIIYLPLIAKDKVIGSLIVSSTHPNAYSQRHLVLLEQLASQIAMPVENTRLYAKVEEQARVDALTGLLNRRALDEIITMEISRHSRYGGVLSVIVLDLDDFKSFNDNHGHLAGDKLLRRVGDTIKNTIRAADQAFRYGGDEFAILLPQTNFEAAYEVAERLRELIAAIEEAGETPVTASLGLAGWPIDGIGPNEIIAVADAALYQSKRAGGNQSHHALDSALLSVDKTLDSDSIKDTGALSTIYALSSSVDIRGYHDGTHAKKVSEYAIALAEALKLKPAETNTLETCALLHDIGKISISDKILSKRGKLTSEEWEAVKAHPQIGAKIVGHISQLAHCIPGILHHHEWYDGSGYPEGLKGENIPLEARILTIADAFAAMTSDRSYAGSLPIEEALEEIKRGAGRQFDPHLAGLFVTAIKAKSGVVAKEL